MKRIISLVLFILLTQPSFANDWFPQIPSEQTPNIEKIPTVPDPTQIPSLFLKSPCDSFVKMTETIKKYKEELLFSGTGLTFSSQTNQPYRGGMFFFTNQDTGSWTLLQAFGDGMACMIMNGKNFNPYTGEQPYGEKQ